MRYGQAAQEYEARARAGFEDIYGKTGTELTIDKVEDRAVSIPQLWNVYNQALSRCVKEEWKNEKGQRINPDTVNLYDVVKFIICPVTRFRKCSYVELLAVEKQKTVWFVSHWWGQPVIDFIKCLEQHAKDHCLDKDTTYYWVCAYAINQWDLELGDTLEDSPLTKALGAAKGTVSILDSRGVAFSRVWCAYELYVSLILNSKSNFKWCVYTSIGEGRAVGLTQGNAPIDSWESSKWQREQHFPVHLLKDALHIDVENAEASERADKEIILKMIGNDVNELNSTLRGRFAAAGLRCMLENNDENIWLEFLQAIKESEAKSLSFDFGGCRQFNVSRREELRNHIYWNSLKNLTLNFGRLEFENIDSVLYSWNVDKITQLSLAGNGIGDEACISLGNLLRRNKSMKKLNLSNNKIQDGGCISIGNALKENSTLERLSLSNNKIEDDGCLSISQALQENGTLQILHLNGNNIKDVGCISICRALKTNVALRTLYVNGNDIGDICGKYVCEALETNNSLEILNLGMRSWGDRCNHIGDKGVEFICQGLKLNQALKELNLGGHRTERKGAEHFSEVLKTNKTLETLVLSQNNIGPEGAKAIANALKGSRLQVLSLNENHCGPEGAKAIANALKGSMLQVLSLNENHCGPEGAKAIAVALMNFSAYLHTLNFVGNKIGDAGAGYLAESLKSNEILMTLNLEGNYIGDVGAAKFTEVLKVNSKLKNLVLLGNNIREETKTQVETAWGNRNGELLL